MGNAMPIFLYSAAVSLQRSSSDSRSSSSTCSRSIEVVIVQTTAAKRILHENTMLQIIYTSPVFKSSCVHSFQRLEVNLSCSLIRSGYHVSTLRMEHICQREGRVTVSFLCQYNVLMIVVFARITICS